MFLRFLSQYNREIDRVNHRKGHDFLSNCGNFLGNELSHGGDVKALQQVDYEHLLLSAQD